MEQYSLNEAEKKFKKEILEKAELCPLCHKQGLLFLQESRSEKDISYLHCCFCRHSFRYDNKNKIIQNIGKEAVYEKNDLFFKLLYAIDKK